MLAGLFVKIKLLWDMEITQDDVLTFETEKGASDFIDEVNKKAKEYHMKNTSILKELVMGIGIMKMFSSRFSIKLKENGKRKLIPCFGAHSVG